MYRAFINDPEEAQRLFQQAYSREGDRQVRFRRYGPDFATSVWVGGPRIFPLVLAGTRDSLLVESELEHITVIKRCIAGRGTVVHGRQHIEFGRDQTVPLSPTPQMKIELSAGFSSLSLRLDNRKLEQLCSQWLGRPLDGGLRFVPKPFSRSLQRTWDSTLVLIQSLTSHGIPLPTASEEALEEFVLRLLLRGHPHNYTEELQTPDGQPTSLIVRRAIQYAEGHSASELTPSNVAAAIGVSIRVLQAGFRRWRDVTPTEYLRDIRLQRVRESLLQAQPRDTVSDIALRHGFFHLGRFCHHYKMAFGETPASTLARAAGSSR